MHPTKPSLSLRTSGIIPCRRGRTLRALLKSRWPVPILAVFVTLLCLVPSPSRASSPNQSINVVMDDNYPPFIMRSEDGTLKGILVDQWQLWEKKTGIHPELSAMDWAEAQRRMLAGEFDVIDTIFKTPSRTALYDFSKPYATIDVPLYFHTDISGIKGGEDARGFVVGVKAGDAVIERLQAQGATNLLEFNSYEAIVDAARDGKIKVFSVDRPPALYFLNRMGISDRFRETAAPLYSGEFHRAVRKGNTQLLSQIERGFAKITAAEYQAIDRRWLGTAVATSAWHHYALTCLAIIAGLVFLLLIWIGLLRHGIEKRTADLQHTSEYLKAVLDSVNDAIFVHDSETGAIIDANQAMLDMYCLSREEALAASVDDLSLGAPPYSQSDAMAWLAKARAEGPQTFEWMARRYQGEVFPVEVSLRFCRIGANPRYLVTVRDITARKKSEESLAASEKKYRELYESMADAFVRVDMNGRILESNTVYQDLVGYSAEELAALTYIDLTPAQWHPIEADIVRDQILPLGYSKVYEKEYRRSNGTTIPVELRTFLIRNRDGEPEGMWAIVRDISERRRIEEDRREMERKLLHTQKLESLGVMAGGIAHDFNNLLMAIQGNLELAMMDIPSASPAQESLANCMQAIRRATDLTRQMLAYSGKGHFVIEPIDLNALVLENFHLFKASIAKTVKLTLHLGQGLPAINADAGQIQQVIMNLITNAAEALDQQAGVVTIRTGVDFCDENYLQGGRQHCLPPPGNFAWVEVTDTGCGMDEETLERLFDPFFTTKFTGRGLGTSAILGIIHGHNGAIIVDSTPNHGTSFKILLPAAAMAPSYLEVTPPSASPGEDRPAIEPAGPILLVDDEDFVRQVCSAMLERLGWHHIFEAKDGMEAVEIFSQHSTTIRCAIIDLSMPRMDGMATFRAIQAISPNTPVIIASGFSEEELTQNFTDQGVAGFIAKPFTLDKLRDEINRVLTPQTGQGGANYSI